MNGFLKQSSSYITIVVKEKKMEENIWYRNQKKNHSFCQVVVQGKIQATIVVKICIRSKKERIPFQ